MISKSSWIPVPKCRNHRFDLGIGINFIETCFLHSGFFHAEADRLRCTASRGFAEPPAESPSTRKISQFSLDPCRYSLPVFQAGTYRPVRIFFSSGHALFCSLSHAGKAGLFNDRFATAGFCSRNASELSAHDIVDCSLASLFQVSALSGLELRLLDFDADNRRHTSRISSRSGSVRCLLTVYLPAAYSLKVFVSAFRSPRYGYRPPASYVVDETVRIFLIGIVVLHRNLNENAVSFSLADDVRVERRFALVQKDKL